MNDSTGTPTLAVLGARRSRERTPRARTLYYIAAAVLAALVPLILFAGLWVQALLVETETNLESYISDRAAALSARIDAHIEQQISVLQAIASVPSLDAPDLAAFELTASRMVSAIPQWAAVALVDPTTGQQIFNSLHPLGASLPVTMAPEIVRRVAAQRVPALHTRYRGEGVFYPGDGVVIYVPVTREGIVRYVLAATVRVEAIQQLLAGADQGLLTLVVDERERILARSRADDEFRGKPANEQLRVNIREPEAGHFVAQTLDGEQVFTAFRRSARTGWLAVAATDRQHYEEISKRSTWTMVGAGAFSFTIAAALATVLFHGVVERRLAEERLTASRALGELDARLLSKTQEALAEQRKSASEREVLLREIYHRVKNNLQIIQSLLRLGSRNLEPQQREPFENAVRRIGAMARVHTLLYKSPDLASIDFKDYLEDLIQETANGFGADLRGITTRLDAQSMRVPLDTAVPLAFITVEILTNAFKHAFPDRRGGTISITAKVEGEDGILVIADSGVGTPARPATKRALGLTLVSKLVEQIRGTLETPQPGSSTYRVTFPLSPPTAPSTPEI